MKTAVICVLALLTFCAVQGSANQTGRKTKHKLQQEIKSDLIEHEETEDENTESAEDDDDDYTTEIPKSEVDDTIGDHLPNFSRWTSWGRCEDCLQSRSRNCINANSCADSWQTEVRTCKSKRCKRRRRRRKDDIVVQLKNSATSSHNGITRPPKRMRIWSRWSKWAECASNCRTSRFRSCRKPGRCRKKIQTQNAYCYREASYCQIYVLNMIDKSQKKKRVEVDGRITNVNNDKNNLQYGKPKPRQVRCGIPFRKTNMLKIIGGNESQKHKWPWHAAVLNVFGEVFCGGTLISPRWVLTAAHCLRTILFVRLNEHDLNYVDGNEIDMRISRIHRHPKFNRRTVDNDIALLKLPVTVRVPTACLPTVSAITGQMCHIVGWGKRKAKDLHGVSRLQEATLPVVSNDTCSRAYRSYLITKNMFCAGYNSGAADTCAGDSGGGLMCPVKHGGGRIRGYAIQGITSFGDGCGLKNKFGIYTAVHNYLQWIKHVIDNYSENHY